MSGVRMTPYEDGLFRAHLNNEGIFFSRDFLNDLIHQIKYSGKISDFKRTYFRILRMKDESVAFLEEIADAAFYEEIPTYGSIQSLSNMFCRVYRDLLRFIMGFDDTFLVGENQMEKLVNVVREIARASYKDNEVDKHDYENELVLGTVKVFRKHRAIYKIGILTEYEKEINQKVLESHIKNIDNSLNDYYNSWKEYSNQNFVDSPQNPDITITDKPYI